MSTTKEEIREMVRANGRIARNEVVGAIEHKYEDRATEDCPASEHAALRIDGLVQDAYGMVEQDGDELVWGPQ